MIGNNKDKSFAEDVSASLSRRIEEIGIGKSTVNPAGPSGGGAKKKPAAKRDSGVTPPTADGMEEALESSLNQALGKADGDFLAGLLDGGDSDDPALRDYGDRYVYLDVIGEGGQGKVLRFRDVVLDRDVAIKVVKPPHTKEREKLLENEARLGGMLEHPNILPTYDLCRDETGSPFFVMKKVEGVSLDQLLKQAHADVKKRANRDQGEYSRRRLLNIFIQVCHAMQYAHSRGVCHLDLKPQNVKLGPFGEVYVLDWGFATRAEDNPKLVAGTPLYIAPERFSPGKPDARCDIYSLGVMLYRILVNQLPRDVGKTSFRELRRRIHEFPIVPPRKRDPSLPRDLEAIVMKALAENPAERYQSVGDLAGDLERFLDIMPVTAYREGWYGRAIKFTRRHRSTVVAGLVMLIAVGLTAGMSVRAKRLAVQAEEAERRVQEEQRRVEEERLNRERANLQLIMAEEAQKRADEQRRMLLRRRAAARLPLEKGKDIMNKSQAAVLKERDKARKLQLIQPALDLFSQALDILEEDGTESPDAAEAYYERARAYEQAREVAKAKEDYIRAFQRDESYIMARYYLGLLYFNQERNVQKALAEFAAMNEIDPGNDFSEVGQAHIEANTGRDAAALARVDRIEARERAARGVGQSEDALSNPGLYNAWLIRGLIYGREGGKFYDPERAVDAYSRYVIYDPEKPAPYINRGALRLALRNDALRAGDKEEAERQLDAAIADFTQALAVDPESKLALQHRGFALFKFKNKLEEGLADIEHAIRLDPNYTVAILDRAAIRETQGKYDMAEKDYELVKQIQPENRNVDYRLGILYLYTNKLAESEDAFDVAVEKSP
ncbi:MAG: protein kinase [Planctomycetes bacterium]|nr:protein kinase [Planctomycetota bacterium]